MYRTFYNHFKFPNIFIKYNLTADWRLEPNSVPTMVNGQWCNVCYNQCNLLASFSYTYQSYINMLIVNSKNINHNGEVLSHDIYIFTAFQFAIRTHLFDSITRVCWQSKLFGKISPFKFTIFLAASILVTKADTLFKGILNT